MTATVLLLIILGFPLVLGLFFRVASSHIFFSLMAGELLARYFGEDLEHIIQSMTLKQGIAEYAELIILVMPMLLTAYFLKSTMKRRNLLLQVIPLAITGIVFAAFVLPILPEHVQEMARQEKLGEFMLELDSAVIAIVVCTQLIALWVQNRMAHAKENKKRK